MKKILQKIYESAVSLNYKNILSFLDKNKESHLLDLGCHNGNWTLSLARKIGTKKISGIEIVKEAVKESLGKGIKCLEFDLCKTLPFKDKSFDVVHANQVIEHVPDIDHFVKEVYRILKPNGYAVISTENGSSWCNIFASIMGWQIFSLTNMSSKKSGIGNPLAIHRNEGSVLYSSCTHRDCPKRDSPSVLRKQENSETE